MKGSIRKSERPADYDLFRYNSRYYTFQRGNWYSSQSVKGPYVVVPASSVPGAFRTVKKTYWVNYPSGWTYMTPGASGRKPTGCETTAATMRSGARSISFQMNGPPMQ